MLGLLFISSCSTFVKHSYEFQKDGKYDVGFPLSGNSEELEKIANSIKLVNSIAFYRKYSFPQDSKIRMSDLSPELLKKYFPSSSTFNKTASGTATIILINGNNALLLTCAHILSFPDTLISYFSYQSGIKSSYIESISIKVDQSNFTSFTENGNVEIVAMNKELDVAFLKGKVKIPAAADLSVFNYKWGNSDELDWGNFVYVFGFPLHNKTVSSGIVSKPESENRKTFVIDANVNRGSSGGLVIAIRDGSPNFELVGIISWVPAEKLFFLKPTSLQNEQQYQSDSKYSGDLFIGDLENIKYGVTKAVSINSIKEMINKNKIIFEEFGFNPEQIFNRE
ncbi:MAG: hypothetical protein Fur0015_11880 [Ignavibacteriales bacterium]